MEHMKLENWSRRDYQNLYDEIMVNFIPSYRPAPPPGKFSSNNGFQKNPQFDRGLLELIATGRERVRLKSSRAEFSEEDKAFVKRYVQLKGRVFACKSEDETFSR